VTSRLAWPEISGWISRSKQILIKKLSRNDCSWADDPRKHQAGFYVPDAVRKSGFFPELANTNPARPHIIDARYDTFWPASGEIKNSALKHYTNKGTEFHCTRVPREQFASLSPASLLIGGRLRKSVDAAQHWFIVVDSATEEAEIIEAVFSLDSDFHFGLFSPNVLAKAMDDQEQLIAELRRALRDGKLDQYIDRQRLAAPSDFARLAQDAWLREAGLDRVDPFLVDSPGEAVMRISRDIEFTLYKQAELRLRAAEVARILFAGEDPVASLIRRFGELDRLFLSAAQTRKSRAGLSFEHHVQRLLVDGRILHEPQVVVGGRRPDFVLPEVSALKGSKRDDAMILSLKTTLRERWKQLGMERPYGTIFLATVDDRVSFEAITEMARSDITLVVPESLKVSKEAVYAKNPNVITFRDFFRDEIRKRRPTLISAS